MMYTCGVCSCCAVFTTVVASTHPETRQENSAAAKQVRWYSYIPYNDTLSSKKEIESQNESCGLRHCATMRHDDVPTINLHTLAWIYVCMSVRFSPH